MAETFDVVIIGAGHIGLSTSYFLKKAGISHVVLEKNDVASTWSSQRWDSFNLVLPNWSLKLPDFHYNGDAPNGFMDLKSTIEYIKAFTIKFRLPVQCGVEVLELKKDTNFFLLRTNQGPIQTRSVVVATGAFNQPYIPEFSQSISEDIQQLHSSAYRNPQQVTPGSVFVVGTGQSGAQIADELHKSGRKVFLSVSRCGGRPRRYRGQDCTWWMQQMGYYDQKSTRAISLKKKLSCNVPLTGQNGGVDINLNEFSAQGIQLLGRIVGVNKNEINLSNDLNSNLEYADSEWQKFLNDCDSFALKNSLLVPLDPGVRSFKKCEMQPYSRSLNLGEQNIKTIVWATGFKARYPWISLPLFNSDGFPDHDQGITSERGLFFVGLPWQSKKSSSLFLGSSDDAEFISKQVMNHLITG